MVASTAEFIMWSAGAFGVITGCSPDWDVEAASGVALDVCATCGEAMQLVSLIFSGLCCMYLEFCRGYLLFFNTNFHPIGTPPPGHFSRASGSPPHRWVQVGVSKGQSARHRRAPGTGVSDSLAARLSPHGWGSS